MYGFRVAVAALSLDCDAMAILVGSPPDAVRGRAWYWLQWIAVHPRAIRACDGGSGAGLTSSIYTRPS